MNKRIVAALMALVLATVGIFLLINYAKDADERAFNDAALVEVLQVSKPIAADAKADDLNGSVTVVSLPQSVIAKGAISSLKEVSGMSTTTTLEPGEQVLLSRFAKSGPVSKSRVKSVVPAGMQEVTIALDAARSVGGAIKAGDHVGVIASFQPKDDKAPQFSDLILHGVLVTRASTAVEAEAGKGTMVTVAVKTIDAEKLVFSMEWGKVWLTEQNTGTDRAGAKTITVRDVVR